MSFNEHVKQFNKMFNNLNPLHFDKFTYLMAEAVVNKVKLANELLLSVGAFQNGNRLRDVQTWSEKRLYSNAVKSRIEWTL